MSVHLIALVGGLIALSVMAELLRRGQLKEKYAVLWLLVGAAMLVLAIWPQLIDTIATAVGVKSGANLLLFIGVLVLTLVCVHLSWEVSRLEDRSRALAEELGVLRLQVEKDGRDRAEGVLDSPRP
jgi:hypothetical protein